MTTLSGDKTLLVGSTIILVSNALDYLIMSTKVIETVTSAPVTMGVTEIIIKLGVVAGAVLSIKGISSMVYGISKGTVNVNKKVLLLVLCILVCSILYRVLGGM